MITLKAYINEQPPETVNKTLGEATDFTGVFYGGVMIFTPQIQIQTATPFEYNYIYIQELGKYYFVQSVANKDNNFIVAALREDVLMTYRNEILNAYAQAITSETGNKYLSNRTNVRNLIPNTVKLEFDGSGFDETGNIIMVTIKGK